MPPLRPKPLPARLRSCIRSGSRVALLLIAACGPEARRGSAILVTLDTTRADALGPWSAEASVTPALDALAAESTVFANAHTVAPLTVPSHASMLTGLYPIRHRVRDNGLLPLPASARTLAEAASEAGIDTAAFLATYVLAPGLALDQGFATYDAPDPEREEGLTLRDNRRAREMVDRALAWLDVRDPRRPFFLWVHFFDPHAPYEPAIAFHTGTDSRSLYRGEVAGMDAQLGRFFDALRERGLLDAATVLVVADHGESLGDNGEVTHGAYCYEPTLHVPLFLRRPGGGAAARSEAPVSVVDVAPTLAEALGVPFGAGASQGIDGTSLLGTLDPDRGLYFECYGGYLSYGWSPLAGWIDARGKYVHSSEPEFFDLAADPGEGVNLAPERAAELEPYRRAIERIAALPALEPDPDAAPVGDEEDLRALGYAAAGDRTAELPHPLAPVDRPSPWRRKQELADALLAWDLWKFGRRDEAISLFHRVVEQNPGNAFALENYAACLIEAERYTEAIAPLRRLLADGVDRAGIHYNLGACLWTQGDREGAIHAFERAVALDPENPELLERLVIAYQRAGRKEEGEPYRRRLQGLRGSSAGR